MFTIIHLSRKRRQHAALSAGNIWLSILFSYSDHVAKLCHTAQKDILYRCYITILEFESRYFLSLSQLHSLVWWHGADASVPNQGRKRHLQQPIPAEWLLHQQLGKEPDRGVRVWDGGHARSLQEHLCTLLFPLPGCQWVGLKIICPPNFKAGWDGFLEAKSSERPSGKTVSLLQLSCPCLDALLCIEFLS